VLRALQLGDLLTALPALRALARAFPSHRRTLAAPTELSDLVRYTGTVHDVVDARPLRPLDHRLHGADLAVNLHGRGPESTAVLAATGPRRMIAFGAGTDVTWRAGEHEVARWCRLLEGNGIVADVTDLHLEPPDRVVAASVCGATIVHPGAAAAARRWPHERWAAVARWLHGRGEEVVVTGGGREVALAQAVAHAAGLPRRAVLAGTTDLLDLVATVGAAARVVCGDTGVAHVATATATPSVVLFGPTSPEEWGPPPHGHHLALWGGDHGDPHAPMVDRGLLELSVGDVIEAIERLDDLRAGSPPAAGMFRGPRER
jgi:ADP-heptose:LPS heptosyltransferase